MKKIKKILLSIVITLLFTTNLGYYRVVAQDIDPNTETQENQENTTETKRETSQEEDSQISTENKQIIQKTATTQEQPVENKNEVVPEKIAESEQEIVETEKEFVEYEEISYPAFSEYRIVDDVKITLEAQEGVFPEGAVLSVEKVAIRLEKQVTEAIDQIRDEDKNVAVSYTFDIKVLDKDGNEIQPKDMNKVKVSFEMVEVQNNNLTTEVYHIDDKQEEITSAQVTQLETTTEDNVVSVETDSFSFYTVEFTYDNKQYVLEGDSYVKLNDILSSVELSGVVKKYEVSNSKLFNVFRGDESGIEYVENYDDTGCLIEYYPINKEDGNTLYMVALQPFATEEWLKVTIEGIEYTIVVTDAIRVDENGDQVATNVRFMQESTTIGTITDSRVIQGPLEDNFTASMPLAEIYIDDTIVNQTLWSEDEYNGTRVIAELLVDNTQGKYAGFQINTDTSSTSSDKGTLQNSYGGLWYDFSKRYLNDTQTLTVSGSSANNYELFSGDIVKYTLKGMATKFDVASNAYKNYDVVITYSDILITLCQGSGTGSVNQANISSILKLIDTNMVNFSWTGGFRAGLSYNVNVKVVDPDTGALIDGSYYYPMTDIDIGRTGIGGFANLYNASNLNRYSEQVALISNYGRPTSSGSWEQKVWIPGGNYSAAPFTNKANVTEDNYPYTCNITSNTIDGRANTLLISPGGTTTAVSGKITTASGVDKDNTFYSGFITLANNTAGGINVKGYASAPTSGGVESYILTGSQIVNHKVDASSDVGGTIFTTTTGNADGSLSGGTLLGYNEINKPFEISAATGQSVTYTMTPKGGYKLKNVWIKDGDIDIMTIVNAAKATVNESDYDTDSDGELDENEKQAYEAAVETAINTALTSDLDTSAISISSLTSLGKGVYTYTFTGIQDDKSIHIDWEKTDLTVTKDLDPAMQGINDKFKFRIELSDTTTEETTWRVRAKKNTGTLNYTYPLEDGKPYYMTYYESRTEEVPYKYVVVSDTTDKNPYEEGWYYYQNGTYYPAYDTAPSSDTTYYVKDDTQTSTIRNYYHHILGWNETTQTWDDKVITAPNDVTTNVNLGIENLNKELSDNYRFVSDGTHVYSVSSYDEIEEEYTDYLIWVLDDTINQEVLVIGNLEKYPSGRVFIADYNTPSRYTYIFNDGVEDYSRKIIHYRSSQVIEGVTYDYSNGHHKYEFVEDASSPVYYNLQNNPESYTLDSGYSAVEGESGLYIITLPAGQNPDTIDLLNNGWEVSVNRVGAIEDDFNLEQAMIQAGATPVPGAVNTFEFTLGVNETIDFNGVIPVGYNYVISEVLPTNSKWKLLRTSGNESINDFDGEENVTFTNTEKRYNVTIEKQTVDDIDGSFDFTIEIYREHIDFGQVYGVSIQAYKNSQDVAPTYKLSNSGSPLEISVNNVTATIPTGDYIFGSGNSNLDSLINYLIDMDNSTNHAIHIGSDEADASTGVHTSLSSQVQEYIDGGYTSFSIEPVGYEFSTKDIVTKIPYIPATLPTGFSGSNGVYTFNLMNGESNVFTNIPFGYKYEITETLPQGWENDSKVNEKGILNNADVVSTWVNKQKSYSLTINKETVNNDSGEFNFVLVIYGETQFFKTDIERHSWSNISNGNLENYSCSFENQKFKYIPGLEFINNRQSDNYPHYRVAEYFDGIESGSIWSGADGGGQYNVNDFSFMESSVDTFTPTGISSNGGAMIRPERVKDTYTFAAKAFNSYDIDTQSYTYEIYENEYDSSFFNNELGYYAHVNEFTLNNGESITIPNIPYGYNYEVYEVDPQGNKVLVGSSVGSTYWRLKSIDGNNIGTINQDVEVTFTNEIKRGSIKVNKETKGNEEGEFNFKIKVWDDRKAYDFNNLTKIAEVRYGLDNDKFFWRIDSLNNEEISYYDFSISDKVLYNQNPDDQGGHFVGSLAEDGEDLSGDFEIIPFLTTYVFYRGVGEHGEQNTSKYNFENTRDKITVNGKEYPLVINSIGEPYILDDYGFAYDNLDYYYEIYIPEETLNAPSIFDLSDQLGEIGNDGYYGFTVKNGENFVIEDIPFGYKYEVYEETQDGWDLVSIDGLAPRDKAEGIVESEEPYEHTFLNAKRHTLVFEKKVSGNMGDKYKEFEFEVRIYGNKTIFTDNVLNEDNLLKALFEHPGINQKAIKDVYQSSSLFQDETYFKTNTNFVYNGNSHFDFPVPAVHNNYITAKGMSLIANGSYTGGRSYSWGGSGIPVETGLKTAGLSIQEFLDLSEYGGTINDSNWSDDYKWASSISYTFKLKHGDKIEIPNIPYGYTYEIYEKNYSDEGYSTKVDNNSVCEIYEYILPIINGQALDYADWNFSTEYYTEEEIMEILREEFGNDVTIELPTHKKNECYAYVDGKLTEDKEHAFENINQVAVPTEVRIRNTTITGAVIVALASIYLTLQRKKKSEEADN